MCEHCGMPVDMIHNYEKHAIVIHNCPRCGHKLAKPLSLPGTQLETEGNPTRERKTLLD